MGHRNTRVVGQVSIVFASILFFDNKLFRQVFVPKQSANVNANSNSSQATALSKLLEQRKKRAAAARRS
jgi:hypothetical protein